jgi:hypothetical protein
MKYAPDNADAAKGHACHLNGPATGKRMTPKRKLKPTADRAKSAGKGIILFHDPKTRTAAMLPAFCATQGDNHYRVAPVVPTSPGIGFGGVPAPEIMCESRTIRTVFMPAYVTICAIGKACGVS